MGKRGSGARLYKGTGETLSTAVFTKNDVIALLKSIGEQTLIVDEVETTTLDSGAFKEFEPTMKDNGSFTISGEIEATNYPKLKGQEGVILPWGLSHPTLEDVTGKFMGWISELTRGEMTPSENITFSATIRISGAIEEFEEPIA